MVRFALLVGAVVAPLTALAVFLDASRRSLSHGSRFVWAVVAGLGSLVGFLLPVFFPLTLHRLWMRFAHGAFVAVTPYEILLVDVGIGVAVTAIAVLVYGLLGTGQSVKSEGVEDRDANNARYRHRD